MFVRTVEFSIQNNVKETCQWRPVAELVPVFEDFGLRTPFHGPRPSVTAVKSRCFFLYVAF